MRIDDGTELRDVRIREARVNRLTTIDGGDPSGSGGATITARIGNRPTGAVDRVRPPGRPRRLAIGVLAAAAMLVGACGADSADSDTGTDLSDEVEDVADEAAEAVDDVADEAEDVVEEVDDESLDEGQAELAAALRDNGMGTLATAVERVDLGQVIDSDEFTLLGPNDDAFLALESDALADLLANPDELIGVLRNHVVESQVLAADLADGDTITTAAGNQLTVSIDGSTVMIGDATVVTTDIQVGSGVIHTVDQVLIP